MPASPAWRPQKLCENRKQVNPLKPRETVPEGSPLHRSSIAGVGGIANLMAFASRLSPLEGDGKLSQGKARTRHGMPNI